MTRCTWTKDYAGVVLGCKLPAGHDEVGSGLPKIHDPGCRACTGEVPEVFPTPGVRCTVHGTREPGA